MKKTLALLVLCAGINLTACSGLPVNLQGIGRNPEQKAVQTAAVRPEEPAKDESVNGVETETEESQEETDLEMALFRSTASTAQMEITTGLTTEYLGYICNFPVRVVKGDQEIILKDEKDLDNMGLEPLYTDELLKAMKDFDTEKLEIQDETAIVGDINTAYVVLGKDENDIIGITEFHYEK